MLDISNQLLLTWNLRNQKSIWYFKRRDKLECSLSVIHKTGFEKDPKAKGSLKSVWNSNAIECQNNRNSL